MGTSHSRSRSSSVAHTPARWDSLRGRIHDSPRGIHAAGVGRAGRCAAARLPPSTTCGRDGRPFSATDNHTPFLSLAVVPKRRHPGHGVCQQRRCGVTPPPPCRAAAARHPRRTRPVRPPSGRRWRLHPPLGLAAAHLRRLRHFHPPPAAVRPPHLGGHLHGRGGRTLRAATSPPDPSRPPPPLGVSLRLGPPLARLAR